MTMSNTGNSEQTALSSYVADALASLSADQLLFIKQLPKAELHAHLNGCIPITVLQQLASQYTSAEAASSQSVLPDAVKAGVDRLTKGITLDQIHDFFGLFPAIYALTSSPEPLALATRAVLAQFLDPSPIDGYPQAAYLELRSTPRESPAMTRLKYVQTVLDEVEKYPPHQAALIVSLDRRMSDAVASECIDCAVSLRKAGRRVVGIDLCGDPLVRFLIPTLQITSHFNPFANPLCFLSTSASIYVLLSAVSLLLTRDLRQGTCKNSKNISK